MTLTVALVSDTFFDRDAEARLRARLDEARSGGARLAVLPEIPLNPWSPATTARRDDDGEVPCGPRHQVMAAAARDVGVGLVGGAIVVDPVTGRRHNTALVFDDRGTLVTSYRKVVLPEEDGFHETSHYEPGDALSPVVEAFGLRLGLQICSDMNRPVGAHLLGALGAEAILNPRATEAATFARWRTVLLANALTSCAYVLSVNRPRGEPGVALGGPVVLRRADGRYPLRDHRPGRHRHARSRRHRAGAGRLSRLPGDARRPLRAGVGRGEGDAVPARALSAGGRRAIRRRSPGPRRSRERERHV